MLKEGGNLLLLDEPTNDLDVETLSSLEAALEDFDLGEVAERHPGRGGHLAQGAPLVTAVLAEDVTEQTAEQDHRSTSLSARLVRASTVPGGGDTRRMPCRHGGPPSVTL
jgi:hypothetical protein